MFHTQSARLSKDIPLISAIFSAISGMLSGVFGKVPYLDAGGKYGLSVSVISLSADKTLITLFAFLLPDQVLVPPNEKYSPDFSNSEASSTECE